MATVDSFEDLETLQKAHLITNEVCAISDVAIFARDFACQDQVRRAALSILSNIAEGFESQIQKAFIRNLAYAKASAGEVRSQFYITFDWEYLSEEDFHLLKNKLNTCSRQIQSLICYPDSQPDSRRTKEEGVYYDFQP